MSTSGTFAFAPSTGELILQAFRRIGIARVAITAEQMLDARMELNLMGSAWTNTGPNLWAVDQQTAPLIQGTATYALDPATVDILDAWISMPDGTDRIITSVSRSTYVSYAVKTQLGQPTTFWLDRLTSPTLTLWPVPDGNGPYILNFMRAHQTQDAVTAGGLQPDVPYRFLDALCWGLAERLAYIYAESKVPLVGVRAQRAIADAQIEDTEDAPVMITPAMGGYFR